MVILIYAPKRIHFGDETYEMRVHLAILDWVCFIVYLFCKNIWVGGRVEVKAQEYINRSGFSSMSE